jgi:hypothetical protein
MTMRTVRNPDDHTVGILGGFTAVAGAASVAAYPFAPGHLTMLLFIVTVIFGSFLLWAVFDLPM